MSKNKGRKYSAIVFFPKESFIAPKKFDNWINDYTLGKGEFQRFLKKKHPLATCFNLYNKDTGLFEQQVKL